MRPVLEPNNIYAHRHEEQDVVLWYNRALWHSIASSGDTLTPNQCLIHVPSDRISRIIWSSNHASMQCCSFRSSCRCYSADGVSIDRGLEKRPAQQFFVYVLIWNAMIIESWILPHADSLKSCLGLAVSSRSLRLRMMIDYRLRWGECCGCNNVQKEISWKVEGSFNSKAFWRKNSRKEHGLSFWNLCPKNPHKNV